MPGFWYTLASYVFEIPVEKRQSEHSGMLDITFHRGQYKLSSDNAVYSFGKHYTSFGIPFEALQVSKLSVSRMLVLGFGLGSVINLLEKNQGIKKIDAVDADQTVLQLAEKYLDSPLKDKVVFHHDDAKSFIEKNRQTYDLVLVDLFVDDKTPDEFKRPAFLDQLKKALAPGGLLLFSKLDLSNLDQRENAQFGKIFSEVFPQAFSIRASGNKIFAARY